MPFKGGILAAADVPAVVQHAGKRPRSSASSSRSIGRKETNGTVTGISGHRVTPHFTQQIYRRGRISHAPVQPASAMQADMTSAPHGTRTAAFTPQKGVHDLLYRLIIQQNVPFRNTKRAPPKISGALWQYLGNTAQFPALRLSTAFGGCGTASALPKCSIRHTVLSALLV